MPKEKNDKSAFLANLGYSLDNWTDLVDDIKKLVAVNEAQLQQNTPFGDIYEIKGKLKNMSIVTIWLLVVEGGNYRFVTLFPSK